MYVCIHWGAEMEFLQSQLVDKREAMLTFSRATDGGGGGGWDWE